ncbi:MAG: Glycerophosphoryl diester phosphodiesterase [uncultured Pseudonocardia sp.]|uniref:Glycerophosphoryl diester phosphodiesterase n=1 Tax=uncultured Pseudonocardia sp. TaxID=211455 RepID=A0A6J4Q100_9PSEU|nr:MAG: Glycerophosphoryl diester phosphodiesterase [uncultured Pseudonocardia sp.]
MAHPYLDGPHPRAYAHRGWHLGDLAGCENTLEAFRRAVDEGFTYLELDVRATADGVAVVHHDATLDRTTTGTGRIDAHTADALTGVRVRGRFPLPRLDEVLAALPDARITVELKSAAVVAPVLAALDAADAWPRVCVGGVDDRWLAAARAGGGSRLCTSMAQASAFGLRSRAWLDALPRPLSWLPAPPVCGDLAQLPHRFGALTVVDAGLVRTAHAQDWEVHAWTVDDPAEMAQLLDLGVDGLLSDRPDVLRAVLRSRGLWPS